VVLVLEVAKKVVADVVHVVFDVAVDVAVAAVNDVAVAVADVAVVVAVVLFCTRIAALLVGSALCPVKVVH
jgi:hypothetical protein